MKRFMINYMNEIKQLEPLLSPNLLHFWLTPNAVVWWFWQDGTDVFGANKLICGNQLECCREDQNFLKVSLQKASGLPH